jgi:hypothetical protein
MIYSIDLDGTLCKNTHGHYKDAKPFFPRIAVINRLYDEGHTINIFTARGATTGIDWRELTEHQLKMWQVKYHTLRLDKPYADVYVDDRAQKDWEFFEQMEEKYHEKNQ